MAYSANRARRVLVVEDDDDSRELYEEMLALHGHEVRSAKDAESAQALLDRESFEVAIIDIALPDVDGHTLARRAREHLGERTPMLVAVSGHARAQDVEESLRAGFDRHLKKPVDLETLASVVASAPTR